MAEIQKAITGATGAIAGAALAISKGAEDKKEKEEAKALLDKHEKQKDLEHQKKVDLLDAKQEALSADAARKDAALKAKLEESKIKQEGLKTQQGQEAELRRLKIGEQRNRVLTSVEKLQLMRAKANDSLEAARDSRRKRSEKAFDISDRLSKIKRSRIK